MSIRILIINPNSSSVITDGLRASLTSVPPDVELSFYTGPTSSPSAITDITTAVLSASACWEDIQARDLLKSYDGFLVCCCELEILLPSLAY